MKYLLGFCWGIWFTSLGFGLWMHFANAINNAWIGLAVVVVFLIIATIIHISDDLL